MGNSTRVKMENGICPPPPPPFRPRLLVLFLGESYSDWETAGYFIYILTWCSMKVDSDVVVQLKPNLEMTAANPLPSHIRYGNCAVCGLLRLATWVVWPVGTLPYIYTSWESGLQVGCGYPALPSQRLETLLEE